MLNIKRILIVLIVSLFYLNSFAQTEERVVIKSMIGKVQLRSPKSGQWRPARVGMPVRMKWDIRTYVESNVELRFENGTILKIGENSVVGLSKILQDKAKGVSQSDVRVATGQVWGNVKKLVNKNSSFKFETPTAVAAIRGTILGIDVSNGKTTVDVVEGKVAVRNKGSNKTVLLETGRRAIVKKGQDNIETMNTEITDPFTLDSAKVDSVKKDSTIIDTTLLDSAIIDSTLIDSLGIDTTQVDSNASSEVENDLELSIEEPIKGDTVNEATVTVSGTVSENASVFVKDKPVVVSAGKFSASVQLTEGDNAIEVLAELDGNQAREVVLVVYSPIIEDIGLSITSPSDGDTLEEPTVQVTGTANDQAEVMVNGIPFSVSSGKFTGSVNLLPGNNKIEVIGKIKNFSSTEIVSVYFDPPKDLFLSVVVPPTTTTTEILINGATTPGAELSIDGNSVTLLPDGTFSYRYLIPDEEGTYSYEIISSYRGKEMVESGDIEYIPEYDDADLVLIKPVIKGSYLTVAGSASPNSEIEISFNSRDYTTKANPDGGFSYEISLNENDFGVHSVDVIAINERTGEEKSKTESVTIPLDNSAINTSVPNLNMVGQVSKATNNGTLSFVATDITPEDELVVTINNEDFEVESGEVISYSLSDGENKITAIAKDKAGNSSNALTEVIYYLPGPLTIEINEPDESMFNIDDLPPMPKNTGALKMDVEVEIDDGIGTTASESQILYVKLNGNLLQSKGNYRFTGSIAVLRGSNNFTVTTEDAAGNKAVKQFTVTIAD